MISDKFVMECRLGLGATAEVFRARHIETQELRALKVFSPLVLSDPETARRVKQESELLMSLKHPNIVNLISVVSSKDQLALELEFVNGSDLRQWSKDYKLHLFEPLLWILGQMAKGLGAAHEKGILHRDLKPENILVSKDGEVKITDFGLARQLDTVTMTKTGLLAGSIGYMAPELIEGGKPSIRSDVFSFGVLAYELITGKNPYAASNPQAVLKNICSGIYAPLSEVSPSLPSRIADLIDSCLKPKLSERQKSIWHVEAEINSYLADSKIFKHCKSLVSTESRSQNVALAFSEKRKHLESLKFLTNNDKKARLNLASEWSYCFPESPEALALLNPMTPAPYYKRNILIMLLASIIISGSLYFTFFKSQTESKLTDPAIVPVPASLAVKNEPSLTKAIDQQIIATTSAIKKEVPNLGFISIDADENVSVSIDGKAIPREQFSKIPVRPGLRKLVLTKEGFLPISNSLEVKSGEFSRVNARTR